MYRDSFAQFYKIITLLIVLNIGSLAGFLWIAKTISDLPDSWTLDSPPDLNAGFTRKLGERDPYQVHGYATMMHQALNSWTELDKKFNAQVVGSDESKLKEQQPLSLLDDYRCLMTPEFKRDLESRRLKLLKSGHYFGQERVVKLIPGKGFADVNVYKLGNSWIVDLPVRQTEYWKGKQLYSRDISFKYRVVDGEARAINCGSLYWNFQLAGFYGEPKELRRDEGEGS